MHTEFAQPADAPAIAIVLREAAQWLADRQMPLWTVSVFTDASVRGEMERGRFLVTRAGEQVMGVVLVQPQDPVFWPDAEPGTSAFLHKLAVRRAWAGQGVPAALLAHAHRHARALGLRYLRLDCVASRHALRALYEDLGWTLHDCVKIGGREFARYERAL